MSETMERGKRLYYFNDRGTERLVRATNYRAALRFVTVNIEGRNAQANDVARVLQYGGKIEEAE